MNNQIELDNPLWQFACYFYQFGDNKTILLALQEAGYSVNLVICLIWLQQNKKSVDLDLIAILESISLKHYLAPFRDIRKKIKAHPQVKSLYEDFLRLELNLEQNELALYYAEVDKRRNIVQPDQTELETLSLYRSFLQDTHAHTQVLLKKLVGYKKAR